MAGKLAHLAAYVAVRAIVAVIQTLSPERCDAFCRVAGRVLADLVPLRRDVLDENLRRVYPTATAEQHQRLRRQMWHHLLLMVCEIAWAPRRLHRTNYWRHIHIGDRRQLLAPLMDARPTVLVTGHFGNFELAGFVTGLLGLPAMTIARPLDNPYLHRYVTQFRASRGQTMVPKDGSAGTVQRHLDAGGTLSLLADQHAGPRGCWVDFLGHPASCHKALALFTLVSGAPMSVITNRRIGGPMRFELACFGIADPQIAGPHLDGVRQLTAWYNQRLGAAISLSPEQYWWVHRRWRERSARRRRKRNRPRQAA